MGRLYGAASGSDMSVHQHRASAPQSTRVAVLTVSDTRTADTDTSGRAARELLAAAGHTIVHYAVVRDDPSEVAARVRAWCEVDQVDAIVTNGGTGLSSRDHTYEALSALIERPMSGFGELFRMLSYAEIGAAAMLSRATAGARGRVMLFACPGSEAAVRLAVEKLIVPELGHIVRELRK